VWKLFDERGQGLIRALDLDRFLIKLPKPLGVYRNPLYISGKVYS
jgi:hypothetical protein